MWNEWSWLYSWLSDSGLANQHWIFWPRCLFPGSLCCLIQANENQLWDLLAHIGSKNLLSLEFLAVGQWKTLISTGDHHTGRTSLRKEPIEKKVLLRGVERLRAADLNQVPLQKIFFFWDEIGFLDQISGWKISKKQLWAIKMVSVSY